MAATIRIEHLQGDAPGTPASPPPAGYLSQVRYRLDDNDDLDSTSPVYLPQDVHTTVNQEITGSNSAQSIRIVNTPDSVEPQVGEYYIIDPGTIYQEVVQISAVASSDEAVTAVFKKNHTYGSFLEKVSASQSKTFRIKVLSAPLKNVTAFRLRRLKSLPNGVYDHYRLTSDYAFGTTVPFASESGISYDPVPTDSDKIFDQASYTTTGYVGKMIEIQWLFTGAASKIDTTVYRISWDES